jgi:hypothetical protein
MAREMGQRMRHLRIALVIALAAPAIFGCGSADPPVPTDVPSPPGLAAPYDFAGVAAVLARREVLVRRATPAEAARAMPEGMFVPMLRLHLAEEPAAQIVSVYLVVADVDSARIQLDSVLAYAVETTGHATGNCISLYDAATATEILGACFLVGRSRP